jgi:hypothetical protein
MCNIKSPHIVLKPGSDNNCSRLSQVGSAEICFGHACLDGDWFTAHQVTTECQLGQKNLVLGKSEPSANE